MMLLEPVTGDGPPYRAFIHTDGSFEIHNVPGGTYRASLTDGIGNILWRELVPVSPGSPPLQIELEENSHKNGRPETVSVTRLQRKLPTEAVRELRLAEAASGRNQISDSISHLKRAIQLAPQMQDARNNLGATYLRAGDFEIARTELEAAVNLDPDTPVPHVNLALALLALNRMSEAEQHARFALRRDPVSPSANFAAGAALERLGRSDEAMAYLERASGQVPQALLIEARILLANAKTTLAMAKLREYIDRPGVTQRTEATAWLDQLSRNQ